MTDGPSPMLTEIDRTHLRRCVELAAQALAAGDEPFGSVPVHVVAPDVTVLGPVDELVDDVRRLQLQFHGARP